MKETQEEVDQRMRRVYGGIRDSLARKVDEIRGFYRNQQLEELSDQCTNHGNQLALFFDKQLADCQGEPLDKWLEFQRVQLNTMFSAAICSIAHAAITQLQEIIAKTRYERGWVKSEVHTLAMDGATVIREEMSSELQRYIGRGVMRDMFLAAAREVFPKDPKTGKDRF